MPDEGNGRYNEEPNDQGKENKRVFPCPIIIAIVVTALKSLFFLVLKGVVFLDSRFEYTFVEPYYNI